MAERSEMSGRRMALHIVAPTLGFLVFGSGGCSINDGLCPPPATSAYVIECVSAEPPTVRTTGPCEFCPVGNIPPGGHCAAFDNSQEIAVSANGAGTCHVELTFASGATSSVDVNFMSVPQACGNVAFVPVGADGGPCYACSHISLAGPMCDAGLEAQASD